MSKNLNVKLEGFEKADDTAAFVLVLSQFLNTINRETSR